MGKYVKGDVVLVSFSYSDLKNAKTRPALVLAQLIHLTRDDVILCQITTNNVTDGNSVEIKNQDLQSGKLLKPSFVRPNRLFTLDANIIERKIGSLTTAKVSEVVQKLVQIIS